jgi:hypothetical protein
MTLGSKLCLTQSQQGFSFFAKVPGGSMTWVVGLTNNSYKSITNTAPGFVNYKKGCTRLAAASDKVYQLLQPGAVLLIDLYEFFVNPTTQVIEPPGTFAKKENPLLVITHL